MTEHTLNTRHKDSKSNYSLPKQTHNLQHQFSSDLQVVKVHLNQIETESTYKEECINSEQMFAKTMPVYI